MAQTPGEGERLYTTICQGCHMSKGEGATGAGTYPKLAGNPLVSSRQYVAMTVLMGRKGMPSFGTMPGMNAQQARMLASLTDEQIAAVVNYVRSHFGNDFKDEPPRKRSPSCRTRAARALHRPAEAQRGADQAIGAIVATGEAGRGGQSSGPDEGYLGARRQRPAT